MLKIRWDRLDSGFIPCKEDGCEKAAVQSISAMKLLKPKENGKMCEKCGCNVVSPEDLKEWAKAVKQ